MDALAATGALEWYAVALAAVHHYRLAGVEEIAAHLRVSLAQWVAIDRAWTAALSAPGAGIDTAIAARFVEVFAQTRNHLLEGKGPPLGELPVRLHGLRPRGADETLVPTTSAPQRPVLPFVVRMTAAAPPPVERAQPDEPAAHGTAVLEAFVAGPVLPFARPGGPWPP